MGFAQRDALSAIGINRRLVEKIETGNNCYISTLLILSDRYGVKLSILLKEIGE